MKQAARLMRRLRALFARDRGKSPEKQSEVAGSPPQRSEGRGGLTGRVQSDVDLIKEAFGKTNELVIRRLGADGSESVAVLYMDGLVLSPAIAEYIVAPVLDEDAGGEPSSPDETPVTSLQEAIEAITYGKCVLLRPDRDPVAFDVHHWAKRAVERADMEPTEIGSQEGFVEDLFTNVALIRRRLRTPKLQTERMTIGNVSPVDVRLVYMADITREALVDEVRGRLKEIDVDTVVGSNTLAEMISDTPWSPFPNAILTVRPDRVVGMLMEGYVTVIVDGSPMAMVVPGTFGALFQAADDYYDNFYVASFTRSVRWLAAFIGLLASSLYVAVISFHHEIIPTRLLFTIAAGREGIPFPPVVEAFFMELAFDLLREAGLRVPSQIGQAVSIVGVLVIGDAAVRAGLVSPLMIVVVGMTAISTFAVPSNQLSNALRLMRFPLIILGGFLGLFGVFFGLLLLAGIVVGSRSFGVPYTLPFIPLWPRGLLDGMARSPMWMQRYRPWQLVDPGTVQQQPPDQRPRPEPDGEGGRGN